MPEHVMIPTCCPSGLEGGPGAQSPIFWSLLPYPTSSPPGFCAPGISQTVFLPQGLCMYPAQWTYHLLIILVPISMWPLPEYFSDLFPAVFPVPQHTVDVPPTYSRCSINAIYYRWFEWEHYLVYFHLFIHLFIFIIIIIIYAHGTWSS